MLKKLFLKYLTVAALLFLPVLATATPFTMTVPSTGVPLPAEYPQAGGVAIVMTGANGNIYYQFSDPTGAFVGFQNSGSPTAFRGNPFTINNPIPLDCGFRTCVDYFGGSIARIDVRFTAYDGDTQVGGFDQNKISLIMNGVNVGNWSGRTTQITNNSGTSSLGSNDGFVDGFGNNTLNTGWFSSTNAALLGNMLATGRTTTQVNDQTPNDNYWDFTRGNSLPNETLRTIAPGYELEKSRDIASLTYATVGQVINYEYVVRNIGSVDISNITVVDNKITSPNLVTCDKTFLPKTATGGTAKEAFCEASYEVTQADIDNGTLTNTAVATGNPQYGTLGALQDTVTLTGPTFTNQMSLEKTASPRTFTALNQPITYTFRALNTGNTTLKNIVVADPKMPQLSCDIAELEPLSPTNTVNSATCQATYLVTQTDIDNADKGIALVNNATATARDPKNVVVNAAAQDSITGPNTTPTMTVVKTATPTTFSAVDQVISYQIKVKNTSIVTWPNAPTVADPLTGGAVCPTGAVAPGATVTCTASYTVMQSDLDVEKVVNVATATVTVNGDTATGSATATVNAAIIPLISVAKALQAGSPNPFSATADRLVYSYTVKNQGNVLIKNLVVSDDKVSLTCPVAQLAAGASTVCTSAQYAVEQVDLNAGFVTNNVTANAATNLGEAVPQATATLTVNANQKPAMSLVKTAQTIQSVDFVPGITVNYSYLVTNTGNVTLTNAIQIIDDKFANPIACPAGAVVPQGTVTCTATYTVKGSDVIAGFVTNTAYAQSGTTTSPTDQETVPQTGTPALSLAKAATDAAFTVPAVGATFDATSDTLFYVFTVTNSGTTTISDTTPITISDPKISNVSCSQPEFLFPETSSSTPTAMTCTGSYSALTQADIDSGQFVNTATASFTFTKDTTSTVVTSAAVTETVLADVTPSFTFAKTAPPEFTALNQPVPFTFSATNTSTQTIASVVVTDPAIPSLNCTLTNLGPAGSGTATKSCVGNYIITQANMDAGTFTNVASASGTGATGTPIPAITDDATILLPNASRLEQLTLNKIADTSAYSAVGDEINYTFSVINTGNVTLKNISVVDSAIGYSCSIPSLTVGATNNTTCTATKTIDQTDIDAGSFVNAASASTIGGASDSDSEIATGPARAPAFSFVKSSGDTFDSVGDVVNFTFAVTNTGNVTLTGASITDTFFNPALSCSIPVIAPGQTDNSTCVAGYTIMQPDLDNGVITNTATATASSGQGPLPPKTSTKIVTAAPEVASFTIDKVETDLSGTFGDEGTVENYGFTISNTGLVTLKNLTIKDPLTGLDCDVADLAPNSSTTICDGGPAFASSYTIQQSDVDAGALTNTVTVNATTTQGTSLSKTDQVILKGPTQEPSLDLLKSSVSGSGFSSVGGVLSYSYTVTNTGNITLTAPITIADNRATVSCPALPLGGLAPNGTHICTATDTVDQADLDEGEVVNLATASIAQPVVASLLYPTGVATVSSPERTATVTGTQNPALSISKKILAGTPSTYDATSDVLTYQFTVKNTGNVTTTGQITVDDTKIGKSVSCGPLTGGIAPNASVTCQLTWQPSQADIDAGSFENIATASMPFGGATVTTTTPASVTVNAVQLPEMIVEKAYKDGSLATYSFGQTAIYDYLITNTGNQTLALPISIEDNLIPTVLCVQPAEGFLAPTKTMSCTGSYTLGLTDVQLGSAVNVAKGISPTVESEPVSEIIPQDGKPAMSITKSANVMEFTKAGDKILYTYNVTNTSTGSPAPGFGNPITIVDDKFAIPIACWSTSADNLDVEPTETVSCTAEYTVTQADMDAVVGDGAGGLTTNFVKNTAFGRTEFSGVDVVSAPVSVQVNGENDASLLVEKSATSARVNALVGDTVAFTIAVTNDGTQTISGILVEDPMLTGLACTVGGSAVVAGFNLAPAQAAECTGTYVVLQSDIDAQTLENTATATGSNPAGSPILGTDSVIYPLDVLDAAVEITKTLGQSEPNTAFAAVGQEVEYLIAVENTGNVTLTGTTVTDILFPGQSCTIGSLAPAAIDSTTCAFFYTVTQSDVNAGEIDNTAKAVSQPATPGSQPVEDTDSINGKGPLREPAVGIGKSASLSSFTAANTPILYSYTIANLGNVSITSLPVVADDKITSPNTVSCPAPPAGGLPPTQTLTCTATYLTTQDDVDAGFVTNTAAVSVANPLGGAPLVDETDLTVNAPRSPALSLTKVANDTTGVVVGQRITYTYVVKNDGNTRLRNVTLSDMQSSAAGTLALTIANNVIALIEPGATATRTATYVVTQADVDAGVDLTNTATATAAAPSGAVPPADATADEAVSVSAPAPKLETLKTAAALAANPTVGTPVTFTITVKNTGNVTLGAITLLDSLRRADTTPISPNPVATYVSGDAGVADKIDVGETWTYTLVYALTQADIDTGGISNSVRATGTPPVGPSIFDISDDGTGTGSKPTFVRIPAQPAMETVKRITANPTTVGATVRFDIDVTNTGNVTLSDVTVSDDGLKRADNTGLTLTTAPTFYRATLGSTAGTVKVGETATYRASYVLTQADIDAGGIQNSAAATANPPVGTTINDPTDQPVVLEIVSAPKISLVKTLKTGGPTFDVVGDVLTYTFNVTNTGNVTLRDQVAIADPLITNAGGTITCAAPPLAPLASLTCEGSYSVTQADINAGKVDNDARARSGSTTSALASVSVPALQEPALETVKSGASITVDGTTYTDLKSEYFVAGAVVGYTYKVTNTGNLTITDPIVVTDNRIANVSCPAFPAGGLAPAKSLTCTANYAVTSTDVRLTSVTNAATAASGAVKSPIVTETVPADGQPALTIEKALKQVANPDLTLVASNDFDEVGDILTYEFTVTNAGTISFAADVTIEDERLSAPLVCFQSTAADRDLRPNESVTCEATYTIVQGDLDAGEVFNEAFAQTLFGPDDTVVISDVDTVTAPAIRRPVLSIAKSAATLPISRVGQVLTYTLTLTNEGNQTLTSIRATDPLIPALNCVIPQMLPTAVETCTGRYTVAQSDIDAGTLVNNAAVTGITPDGKSIGSATSLTLAVPAAAPSLIMTKVGSPQPFGAAGSAVSYDFALENNGNVTLFDLVVTDDIVSPPYTCRLSRLDVGQTDNSCSLSYVVTQDDVDAGEIINVATVNARDPFGPITAVTARSEIASQPAMPSLEATKTATSNGVSLGNRVVFDLYVRNTGDVTLTVTGIADTMTLRNNTASALTTDFAYVSGDSDLDGRLDVSETWRYQGDKIITQVEIDAGGFNNSAVVTAADPFGTIVTDTSDDGNDVDGNTINDVTEFLIVPGPALNVTKTVLSGGSAAGDVVAFQITAINVGTVTLSNVTVSDDLRRADGTDVTANIADIALTSPAGGAGEMAPSDVWTWTVTYPLSQADVDAGGLINTAAVSAKPPVGPVINDRSDNGIDNDGNTDDDETELLIAPAPDFGVVKTVLPRADANAPVMLGEVVNFAIAISNNGNVTLSDLVLEDTMTNAAGTVLTPDSITLTQGASDTQVPVGETLIFNVAYTLTQDDIDAGGIENTATANVIAPSGVPLRDVSDNGDDTDGNSVNDPTLFPITQFSSMEITKEAEIPVRIGTDLFEVLFTITLSNTGNVTQRDLVIEDDLAPFVQPATLSGRQTAVISGFEGTGTFNAGYNGISDINLVTDDVYLLPEQTGMVLLTVTYDTSGNKHPEGLNTAVAKSDRLEAGVSAAVTVITTADPDIVAVKTVTPSTVMLGTTVTYQITFENRLDTIEGNLTIIDDMPAGVIYTPGSARYNGAEVPAPTVAGRQLRWSDVTLAPNEVVRITFDARVVGELGEMVNRAYMLDGDGQVISNVATAVITRSPEAVFECSDIIGKVFDDRNMNGYQDGEVAPDTRAVTDQTFAGGKGKLTPAPQLDAGSPHEPGLANVRLATVNGTIITTDEYGRFSVPCAELPADIGSNFTLKLDVRSLPTGYRVTTENPRVVRVTQGTVSKLNFGAALSNVVDIDLMASAFQAGSAAPTVALVAGIDQLVQHLRDVPSVLRLSYYMNSEGRETARRRLDAVEDLVRTRWRENGRYRLLIERTIQQLQ